VKLIPHDELDEWRKEFLMSGSIHHSGQDWRPLGYGIITIDGHNHIVPQWPIEEYLARVDLDPAEAERIRRLNPNGKLEGDNPITE
jgi:hypothetical protein